MTTVGNLAFFRLFALTVALVTGALLMSGSGSAQETDGTYVNPVSKGFADTFADPAVIKAKDGYWYSYGTSDPLREGEGTSHPIPISRSKDLVNWEYVGDAFDASSRPSWAAPGAGIWAPDIRYLDGKYYMYYVVTRTTVTPERDDNAIGVATAPTPTGPWTDSGAPVVGPRRGNGGFLWTFDPSEFTDSDGKRYLYYGSYNGGIFVTEISADGTRAVGEPTMVATNDRYEGAYVVKREGYYYLFGSSANCCAGPTTGYSVYAGRSESPRGPFLDREGDSLTESRVGGTLVVTPNGNKWIGTGHNSIVTDLSGEDYFAYHAIDRADPYLDGTSGVNERPMLLDRLDWIHGWPTVRGGEWASEDEQAAPATDWIAGTDFNDDRLSGWRREGAARGGWTLDQEEDARGYIRQKASSGKPAYLVSRKETPAEVRAEADLRLPEGSRGAAGLVLSYKDEANRIAVWLDADKRALVTNVTVKEKGRQSDVTRATSLPSGFDFDKWHNVAAEVRGGEMIVEVTDARLGEPLSVQDVDLPKGARQDGSVGIASRGARAEADNAGAAALYEPVTEEVPPPEVGVMDPAFSDEFDGDGDPASDPDSPWSWVRQDPDAQETGGVFRWPAQAADLVGTGNNAGVMLRGAPKGEYIVETKLTIDLGTDTIRNFQQGGLVAYVDDDQFLRLGHVAIWNTRQTEFGKEMPFAGRLSYGGMLIGPPEDTTYLRLSHRLDPENGEHEFRAATSRDGESWVWGGTWTLPADAEPRIGLISHGGDTPQSTSEFDYFRVYRQ